MELYAFHLMPWPHLPADFITDKKKFPSAWVTLSNDLRAADISTSSRRAP